MSDGVLEQAGRGRSRRRRCGPGRRTPRRPRVQLAGVAEDRVADERPRRSGRGATVRGVAARTVTSTPRASAVRRTASSASDQPAGRPAPHQPGRSRVAGDDEAEVQRLGGQRLVELVELAVGRPPVDRRRSAPGPSPRGIGDGRGLEERQVGRCRGPALRATALSSPGSSVVVIAGSSEESGLARRRTVRRGSSAGEAERVQVAGADEREADDLDVALPGQGATDPAAQLLAAGQAAPVRRRAAGPRARCRSRRCGRPPRPGRRGR